MGLSRITNAFMSNQSIHFLNRNLLTLSKLQEKLASNQNINKPSDDPVGITRILSLSDTLKTDARYKRNIEDAIAETGTVDTVTNQMVGLINRAQELATQAANTSNDQAGRDAIALEIDQIIDQLVQLGNTDIGGKYIFGGYDTGQPPFARTAPDVIEYNGTPPTDPWQREVQISRGSRLSINVNGQNLLGFSTGAAGTPPLPAPGSTAVGGQGVFQTMVELLVNLQAGGDPNQLAQIRERLDYDDPAGTQSLATALSTLSSQQSIIGSITNRLDLTKGRIEQREAIFTQQYADIQDIDMASTIATLNQQENTFQASLGVTARLSQISLLNFLR